MIDHGKLAQKAAEEHLAACESALYDEAEMPVTAALYCGCMTCQVREVLFAAWPIIEDYARANPP